MKGKQNATSCTYMTANDFCSRPHFVYVLVGEEKTAFVMRRLLVMKESDFFRSELMRMRERGLNGHIDLPDVVPALFQSIMFWLYQSELPFEVPDQESHPTPKWMHEGQVTADLMVDMYLFGHKYSMAKLCDTAVDHVFAYFERSPSERPKQFLQASTVEDLFNTMDADAPMCRLAVEMALRWAPQSMFTTCHRYCDNVAFVQAVLYRSLGSSAMRTLDPCDFHGHSGKHERSLCTRGRDAVEIDDSYPSEHSEAATDDVADATGCA